MSGRGCSPRVRFGRARLIDNVAVAEVEPLGAVPFLDRPA
jgi:hypothetical protein